MTLKPLQTPVMVVMRYVQVSMNSFDRSEGSPMNPWVGDVFVSILPCWHIFERTAEYFTLTRGVTMVGIPSMRTTCRVCRLEAVATHGRKNKKKC